jgi:hypothetical protein
MGRREEETRGHANTWVCDSDVERRCHGVGLGQGLSWVHLILLLQHGAACLKEIESWEKRFLCIEKLFIES